MSVIIPILLPKTIGKATSAIPQGTVNGDTTWARLSMDAKNLRILWVTPKWPLPAQDGARVATVNLLSRISQYAEVDLLSITGPGEETNLNEAKSLLNVKRIYQIKRPRGAQGSGVAAARLALQGLRKPLLPITLQPYASSQTRAAWGSLVKNKSHPALSGDTPETGWNVLVYDTLHPAAHSSSLGQYVRPEGFRTIVYRAHNFEADIWKRKALQDSRPGMKPVLSWQASRVRAYELSLSKRCDWVATVSQTDLEVFKKALPGVQGESIPIGFPFSDPPAAPSGDDLKLLFLGRLDWPPNRDGLKWFLKEVWPKVTEKRKDLHLQIAGSGSSDWLKPLLAQVKQTEFLGRLPTVEGAYQDTVLSLVPVFYGSGTRVKAIESCRYARACLSTQVGVEGIGLKPGVDCYLAETAEEWVRVLVDLRKVKTLETGRRAFDTARSRFDAPVHALNLYRSLVRLNGQSHE